MGLRTPNHIRTTFMNTASTTCFLAAALLPVLVASVSAATAAPAWRSSLYPENWTPGFVDSEGRFLHDFSYAGYHRGEEPVPAPATGKTGRPINVIDATQPPYGADPAGTRDSTAAIQSALDAAGEAGGGVVFLPAGTYRVAPPEGAGAALHIRYSNTVLRGAGPERTFLRNDTWQMREKHVVRISPPKDIWWFGGTSAGSSSPLVRDLAGPSLRVPVRDPQKFASGERIVLRIDPTPRFIASLGMTGKWDIAGPTGDGKVPKSKSHRLTLLYIRKVVAVEGDELVLDVPTRLPLLVADNARVQKSPPGVIEETGVEDLAIGMRQHPGTGDGRGYQENDFGKSGTPAWDVHQSHAVVFASVENGWLRHVHSYAPEGNDPRVHLLSNGVRIGRGRHVTVEACDFRFPQYRGGGGNGYMFTLHGSENLVVRCHAEGGRHNYDFGTMTSSGNVIHDSVAKDGLLFSDFHMFLSAANLIDNVTCDGDAFEATYRPWGGTPAHGASTTQSVFWNLHGLRYPSAEVTLGVGPDAKEKPWTRKQTLVLVKQLRDITIIGTRGPANKVAAWSADRENRVLVEGAGRGDTLKPRSLYLDQLARRTGGGRP